MDVSMLLSEILHPVNFSLVQLLMTLVIMYLLIIYQYL